MANLHQFVVAQQTVALVLLVCLGLVSGQASTRVYLGRLGRIGCQEAVERKALRDKHLERLGA